MQALLRWLITPLQQLSRELRWSYLPPLMVYMAAGVQGLTGIVGTFFVKEHLGLSAEFLAALGFWAGIPWALKMPIGHLIDVLWRFKSGFILLGAALIAASLLIMAGLILFDTSRIIHGGETNYIRATVGLYLNIFNLFVHLLHLIAVFTGGDD